MNIRHYQPGDEYAQAEIFNAAVAALPAMKLATPAEIARRYRTSDADQTTMLYAVEDGEVIGYAVLSATGRISFPWCRAGQEQARLPLLQATLQALKKRGIGEAWAAYRADWQPVQAFFTDHGFRTKRQMVNYVRALQEPPQGVAPDAGRISPLERADLPRAWHLGRTLVASESPEQLERFYFENAYFDPTALFALKRAGETRGIGLAIVNPHYADPTKLDASMPCFRLGAMGAERERHKRVNGMFASMFDNETTASALLAEAVRRLEQAGLTHAAAQAGSDQPTLIAFYDRHFQRQGSFPVVARQVP
jgi:GNAT superfamily N-acetyltransferase